MIRSILSLLWLYFTEWTNLTGSWLNLKEEWLFFFLLSFGCSTLLVKHDNLIPVIGTSSNKAVDSLFFSYSILVVTFLILMISLFLLGSNKNWLIGLKYSLCSYHMFLLALDSRKKKKKRNWRLIVWPSVFLSGKPSEERSHFAITNQRPFGKITPA